MQSVDKMFSEQYCGVQEVDGSVRLLVAEFDSGVECVDVLEEGCEGGGLVGPKHENVVDEAQPD